MAALATVMATERLDRPLDDHAAHSFALPLTAPAPWHLDTGLAVQRVICIVFPPVIALPTRSTRIPALKRIGGQGVLLY